MAISKREARQPSQSRSSFRMNILLLVSIIVVIGISVINIKFTPYRSGKPWKSESVRTIPTEIWHFCKSTSSLFPDLETIEVAVKQSQQWHHGGGNLKALQMYLDQQILPTLVNSDISFEPRGKTPEQSIMPKDVTAYIHDYFQNNHVQRAGYGNSLPGELQKPAYLRGKGTTIWEKRFIHVTEPWSYDRWNASIGPIGPVCNKIIQLGHSYESKFLCDFEKQDTLDKLSLSSDQDCHIISIGSNDQWGFEQSVLTQTSCMVHTFDCTLEGGKPKHKPVSDRVKFYNYCIASSNKTISGRMYGKFSELWDKTGIESAPKLVKIDVEGFEYDVLTAMISEHLNNLNQAKFLPEQIIVELHWATKMSDLPWLLRTRGAGEISLLVSTLYSAGYMPVYTHYDNGCVPCLEVLFVRVICSAAERTM